MKDNYIIIQSGNPEIKSSTISKRIVYSAKNSLNNEKKNIRTRKLDQNQFVRIKNKVNTEVIARSIPIKLITPVNSKKGNINPKTTNIWGLEAVGALTSPYTGKGVIVAILDTGIDKSHLAFKGVKIIEKDFTGEGNGDSNGHGTHCAAIIAGGMINGERIGIAQGIKKLLAVKVLGKNGGSTEMVVKSIKWAIENGANVISMSLGIDFPGLVKKLVISGMSVDIATSKALVDYRNTIKIFEKLVSYYQSEIDGTLKEPFIIIAASGNESRRDENKEFTISACPPAVCEGFISVGAVGKNEKGFYIASFSNTDVTIAAPGVDIISAKRSGGSIVLSGTSMATPHVAGVAALWIERMKNYKAFTLQNITSNLTSGNFRKFNKIDTFHVGNGMVYAPQD